MEIRLAQLQYYFLFYWDILLMFGPQLWLWCLIDQVHLPEKCTYSMLRHFSFSQLCPSRPIWAHCSLSIISRWTHSEVIWATSCSEVKPELRKLSLYWLILIAASQSSTELKVLKSGMDLSNSGWEGLEKEAQERVRRMYEQGVGTVSGEMLFIWNIGSLNCNGYCYCSDRLAR